MSIQTAEKIGMQPFEQFSAEQGFKAIAHCVEAGVALMPNLLSEKSVENLDALVGKSAVGAIVPESADTLIEQAPELKLIDELLYSPANRALGMQRKATSITHSRPTKNPVHTDMVALGGISVLVPVRGPQAMFAASSEGFDLSHWLFEAKPLLRPEYIGLYGTRDVMLIRQNITSFNCQQIDAKQKFHGGYADEARTLALIDYLSRDILVYAEAS